eukprot:gnl/MRDRNA2_/MRDRNA2_201835_c0_seq1.p1 gnl/MRDRNA2_/MRDRNA2_201835_c0~~gnl/MRDRNA2_/MRDRNA2_201835_c0_seq1.p1  ORF type:complete len:149 (+),score=4.53 gnl/MRDRNA2_/MRDRNA2_201835_c0_seq1:40-486(+)
MQRTVAWLCNPLLQMLMLCRQAVAHCCLLRATPPPLPTLITTGPSTCVVCYTLLHMPCRRAVARQAFLLILPIQCAASEVPSHDHLFIAFATSHSPLLRDQLMFSKRVDVGHLHAFRTCTPCKAVPESCLLASLSLTVLLPVCRLQLF